MAASKALYDKQAQVWDAMKALLAAAADRTLSAQEEETYQRMEADLDLVRRSIKIQEKGDAYAAELDAPADAAVTTRTEPHPATPQGPAGTAAVAGVVTTARPGDFGPQYDYARAFDTYLRFGAANMNRELRTVLDREYRDLAAGTGNVGGFTVPPGFLQRLTDAQKFYGGMLDVSNVIDTDSGNPLQWPTADDTGQVGAIVAEAAAHTIDASTPFAQKTLSSFLYSSKIIKVSVQLLQDSAFDLGNWLPMKMGQRIGRIVNQHFTTGTGAGAQPNGLVPGLGVGKTGATGQTLTVIYDDLIDLIHSVDPAYRPGGRWMMADSSVKVVRKIKDTTGQPIWQPGMQAGQPDSLLGYPLTINQDVAAMAANAKSIVFGDYQAAYVIRRVTGAAVLRLDERFADNLQVGFLAFARYDGVTDDANAAKVYANSAT